MSTKTLVFTMITIAMLCVSCGDDENKPLKSTTIRGSGVPATQTRAIADFSELILMAAGDVNITFGSPRSLEVTVDDNIMPHMETVRVGDRLEIRMATGIDARDYDLVVNVTVESLDALELSGAGSISGKSLLHTDHLDVALTGTGTIDLDVDVKTLGTDFTGPGTLSLSGAAETHNCRTSSVGPLRAFDLETATTDITLSGPGSAEVNASDALVVDLSGLGSVYYIGNPTVSGTWTGQGRVVNSN